MKVLMLCILLPVAVLVGCETVDLVLGTDYAERPITKEEVAAPVRAAIDAAIHTDPETGAVSFNLNPAAWIGAAIGGILTVLGARRAAKNKKMATVMATGIHDSLAPVAARRNIAATIKVLAKNAGVEARRTGLDALFNGPDGLHDLVERLDVGVGRPK